jgi:hypothetical protein
LSNLIIRDVESLVDHCKVSWDVNAKFILFGHNLGNILTGVAIVAGVSIVAGIAGIAIVAIVARVAIVAGIAGVTIVAGIGKIITDLITFWYVLQHVLLV